MANCEFHIPDRDVIGLGSCSRGRQLAGFKCRLIEAQMPHCPLPIAGQNTGTAQQPFERNRGVMEKIQAGT